MDFIKKFPKLAPYNAFLIYMQDPGSRFVAEAKVWREQYGRKIRPSAHPLVILWPFAPVHFVFDIEDTYGQPVPDDVLFPYRTRGFLERSRYEQILRNLEHHGITYREDDLRAGQAGYIRRTGTENHRKNPSKYRVTYTLTVNKKHSIEEKFATIAHELGHIYCGHLGSPDPSWCPERDFSDVKIFEFEAECISWLVCERAGIYSPSEKYLSNYLDENEIIPPISLENVLKAAGKIETMSLKSVPPKWVTRIE